MELKSMQTKREVIEAVQWDGTKAEAAAIMNRVLNTGGLMAWQCTESPCPGLTAPHNLIIHTTTGVKQVMTGDWVVKDGEGVYSLMTNLAMQDQFEEVSP